MKAWLKVLASEGQFSSECAVGSYRGDESPFSMFAERRDMRFPHGEPVKDGPQVAALLHVDVLARHDNFILVDLPQEKLTGGRAITVRFDQLEQEKAEAAHR